MFSEGGAVSSEQLTGNDLLPPIVDLQVCLLAAVLGLLSFVIQLLEGKARERERQEALALEARIHEERENLLKRSNRRLRVERVLEGHDSPEIVYQPIVDLRSGKVSGYEALSRFTVGRPDEWFALAAEVGLGVELELKAIRRALANLEDLPGEAPYLSVNASPATLVSPALDAFLSVKDLRRVVLELTEHDSVNDYDAVRDAVKRVRRLGARLAVDDVGAGYSSLRHISNLEPDIIKLDTSFTKTLSSDHTQRSMVKALVGLAQAVGARIVVEGIEDEATLDVARDLGVDAGQGWHLGKPKPLDQLDGLAVIPAQRRPKRVSAGA